MTYFPSAQNYKDYYKHYLPTTQFKKCKLQTQLKPTTYPSPIGSLSLSFPIGNHHPKCGLSFHCMPFCMLGYAYILTGNSVCIYYPLLLNEGSLRLRIPGIMSVTFWNQLCSWIFFWCHPLSTASLCLSPCES